MKQRFIQYIFTLIFAFTAVTVSGQDFKYYTALGDADYADENYAGAAMQYKKALGINRKLYDVMYKLANSFRLNHDFVEAENYYTRLIEKKQNKYPLARYYLAEVIKSQGDYQRAQKKYSEFLLFNKDDKDFFVRKARNELRSCEKALNFKFDPVPIEIVHIDTTVNTVYGEFGSCVFFDSLAFYSSMILSTSPADSGIFISRIFTTKIKGDTIFEKGVMLDSTINSAHYHVNNPSFDYKNKKLYFTKSPVDRSKPTQIFYSVLENGKWLKPVCLPDAINQKGKTSTHPCYVNGPVDNFFFFSSDRGGSIGKMDIWYCRVKPDGTFGPVYNVGARTDIDTAYSHMYENKTKINTLDDEISPFFDPFDSTLYFSSKWHPGMGNFDIFSSKTDFKTWQAPKNIGYPLNTPLNDLYFNIDNKGKHAYFTSNRKGSLSVKKESCCNDIWSFKIDKKRIEEHLDTVLTVEEIKQKEERVIQTMEKEIKLLVPITLYFDNDYPNPMTWDTLTIHNYEKLYFNYTKRHDAFSKRFARGLAKMEANKAMEEIDNLFSNDIDKGYQKLVEFTTLMEELLGKNQSIVVTLKGYCSPLNTFEYNKNLAKRRISSLINYFNQYKGGMFKKFIENKQLVIEQVPIGKLVDSKASDDPKDPRNSIFSPAASLERKIQIIAVQLAQ